MIEMCNPSAAVFQEPPAFNEEVFEELRRQMLEQLDAPLQPHRPPPVSSEMCRQRLIEQAVLDVLPKPIYQKWGNRSAATRYSIEEWANLLSCHTSLGAEQCHECCQFLAMVRAAFNRLTHADPATSTQPAG